MPEGSNYHATRSALGQRRTRQGTDDSWTRRLYLRQPSANKQRRIPNRSGCATGCCTSAPGSRSPDGAASCTSPEPGRGPKRSRPRSRSSTRSPPPPADHQPPRDTPQQTPGHPPRSPLPRTPPNHLGVPAETPSRPRSQADMPLPPTQSDRNWPRESPSDAYCTIGARRAISRSSQAHRACRSLRMK